MNAQILGRLRGGAPLKLEVPAAEAVLGRDNTATLTVPMDGVSRRHARIVVEGEAYWIQDLGSTNGTFVNGASVTGAERERLRHLDVITLGREAELLFLLRERQESATTKQRAIVRAVLIPEDSGDLNEYQIAVGEATIGRTAASNVVIDRQAISKVHARIQRTTEQLVLQDLSSVNGTFVNGARVMTALLQDNDRLSFANVVSYRVRVEWGELASTSGIRRAIPLDQLKGANAAEPRREWKTRYEWDTAERAAIAAARGEAVEAEPIHGTAPLPFGSPDLKRALAAKAAPAGGAPAVAEPKPAPAPAPAKPPAAPKAAPPSTPIAEIRLTGSGFDLAVTEPGSYDLGRADGAGLRIVHPTVSRQHARLVLTADRLSALLEHTGKTTPTLLNGAVVARSAPLSEGDKILLGEVALTVSIKR